MVRFVLSLFSAATAAAARVVVVHARVATVVLMSAQFFDGGCAYQGSKH